MKISTSMPILFTLFAVIAFAPAACGNNASASESPAEADIQATAAVPDVPAAAPASPQAPNGFDGMPASGTKAFCPVMKNEFAVRADSPSSVYKGKTYVFCCSSCKPSFDENPEKYVN